MRARGANALLRALFETTYGTPPGGNYVNLPFIKSDIGEQQGLLESDLLGQGRETFDPTLDVINDDGSLTVPLDARNFGYWLKLYMGAPVTTAFAPASGSIKFSALPTAGSTITINGTAFTFVASGATGNQINIGASVSATIDNAVTVLTASVVSGVALANYTKTGTDTLTVTYKTAGLAGNSFTLAAGSAPASNGTASGATLSGGTNSHVFTSGASSLPSMSIEIGNPEVPNFEMNFGANGNSMQIGLQRSGLLNAVLNVIAQGSSLATTSGAGTPTSLAVTRFAQATGQIKKDGVQLANIVQANMTFTNSLDKVETIRPDGRIDGADPAQFMANGNITSRFADTTLLTLAGAGTPFELSYGWTNGPFSLVFDLPRIFLPKPKRSIDGPNGIQAAFDWKASGASGHSMTATLVNDVAGY